MKFKIEITREAQTDMETVYTYIAKNLCNRMAAVNLIGEIDKNIKALEDMPYKYPLINDEYLNNMGIRFVTVKNYVIFYTVNSDSKKVYIIRILYARRNWAEILKN